MDLKTRLAIFFGKKINYIEKEWGMYNGYIGKVSDGIIRDESKIRDKLIELKLNPDYFLYGEGKPDKIEDESLSITVPYYELDVMAHIAECLDMREVTPSAQLQIPGFQDCIACFPVYGNSMEPRIFNGDIIAVSSAITSVDKILWGEIYLVITDCLRTVKTVHPGHGDACITLKSLNPDYAGETPVKAEELKALYRVRGVISRLSI